MFICGEHTSSGKKNITGFARLKIVPDNPICACVSKVLQASRQASLLAWANEPHVETSREAQGPPASDWLDTSADLKLGGQCWSTFLLSHVLRHVCSLVSHF
jgi:hypothetical protein